jgi:hypothetical protein
VRYAEVVGPVGARIYLQTRMRRVPCSRSHCVAESIAFTVLMSRPACNRSARVGARAKAPAVVSRCVR